MKAGGLISHADHFMPTSTEKETNQKICNK